MFNTILAAFLLVQAPAAPSPETWIPVLETENGHVSLLSESVAIDADEKTVEFLLKTQFKTPIPYRGAAIHDAVESIVVLCAQGVMVTMATITFDKNGNEITSEYRAKASKFTGDPRAPRDAIISFACSGMNKGEKQQRERPKNRYSI